MFKLWDTLGKRDLDSMAPQVRLMIAVHAFGHRLPPGDKAEMQRAMRNHTGTHSTATAAARLRRRRYYKAADAFLVTSDHLRALTAKAAAMVAATLWLADFKWIASQGASHVHFGYYGYHEGVHDLWDTDKLRSMRLRGSELTYTAGESLERSDLELIDVPYSCESCYIFVRAAKPSKAGLAGLTAVP